VLVRDLRPQGREPWCTCSRGSAPLRRATSLEAARLYLKLSPTRVESLHVPTSRASRATRPSPRLSIRDGPAPRRLRWTAVHRGVRSVWPRSPAPLGRGACKQAGGLSCPRASTEFPDVASPGAPTLCPARRQPLPPASPTSRSRRPRRAATRCGPAAQACRAVGGIPQTDLQRPPHGGAVHYQRRRDATDGVRVPGPCPVPGPRP